MFAKLKCRIWGHRHGRFLNYADATGRACGQEKEGAAFRIISCPRCKATWSRKVK